MNHVLIILSLLALLGLAGWTVYAAFAPAEARAEIAAFYATAVADDDAPQVQYIEALAADIDVHDTHGRPSLLGQLRHDHQTAAGPTTDDDWMGESWTWEPGDQDNTDQPEK